MSSGIAEDTSLTGITRTPSGKNIVWPTDGLFPSGDDKNYVLPTTEYAWSHPIHEDEYRQLAAVTMLRGDECLLLELIACDRTGTYQLKACDRLLKAFKVDESNWWMNDEDAYMTVAHVFRKFIQTLESNGWRCLSFSFKDCPQLVKHFGSIMAKGRGLADPSTYGQIAGVSPDAQSDYGGRLHSQQDSLVLLEGTGTNNHNVQTMPAGSCHKADLATPPTTALVDSLPECESSHAVLHPEARLQDSKTKVKPEDMDQFMLSSGRESGSYPDANDTHAVEDANQISISQCYKDPSASII